MRKGKREGVSVERSFEEDPSILRRGKGDRKEERGREEGEEIFAGPMSNCFLRP